MSISDVDRREDKCREFPKDRPAVWEAPETQRPPHIVAV